MKFVNQFQTKEEREIKYKRCRSAGFNPDQARVFRDWTDNHIDRLINATKKEDNMTRLTDKQTEKFNEDCEADLKFDAWKEEQDQKLECIRTMNQAI